MGTKKQIKPGKITLFSAVCLNIGTIIGAGIFSSLPMAAKMVGSGIVLTFIVAAIELTMRSLPSILPGAAIPCSSGFYMHLCRLVHPLAGYFRLIKNLQTVFLLSLLCTMVADYINMIVPVNPTACAIATMLIFGVIGYFGLQTGTKVQNIMVVILMVVLALFVVFGLRAIDSRYLSVKSILLPTTMTITGFGAALGVLTGALGGATEILNLADDLENPGKTVMSSYFISTFAVCFFYILMGVAVVGTSPVEAIGSLGDSAKLFMPRTFYMIFLVGGALFALCTTINGALLGNVASMDMIARDKVFPAAFLKKNKYGQNVWCLVLMVAPVLFILTFRLNVDLLMSVTAALGILLAFLLFLPVIRLPKRYPHCYRHAVVRYPQWLVWLMIIVSSSFCVYEFYSLIVTNEAKVWWAVLATLIVMFAYFFIRRAYLLRKTGEDLIQIMSAPYEPWEEMERTYAAMDAADKASMKP